MAARETPAEQIERLLRSGDFLGADRVASEMLVKLPQSPIARLGRARARLNLGHYGEAAADLDAALRVAPKDELANYLRGQLDIRTGKDGEGIARLKPIALGRGPYAVEAMFAVLDICYHSDRRDEWRELMKHDGAWGKDIRSQFHGARLLAADDALAGAAALVRFLRTTQASRDLRRHTGFEAAGLYDKAGMYREAFAIARETHATTGDDFDLDVHMKPILEQIARVEQGERWITPSVDPVEGVAILVSLPRSGTTLLEQMLDRHPAIGGIGEYEGLARIHTELRTQAAWPRRPGDVPRDVYARLQRSYLDGAAQLRRPDARWSFDKTIRAWRAIPDIAAVLPGTRCIHVRRSARDTATSLFLSYFQSGQIGWTLNLDTIRRMIELERRLVPRAMEVLGIDHISIRYEDIVDDTAAAATRCLSLLGLPMDERVLAPEQNPRAAVTISAMQVRKPINRGSIGRWRNYDFAFDAAWDALD
jgi:tetratricopeptide (TPR) repeat protein